MPVDNPQKGLEAGMRNILAVPQPEGRGVGDESIGAFLPRNLPTVILAERVRTRRRIARSVYWLGPPEYQRDPERPARTTPPMSTTRPSMGMQPSGAFGPSGSWFPRT